MSDRDSRFRQPVWVGLRFGLYLVGVECLVVILPVMLKLQQSGLLAVLISSVVLYGAGFSGLAWLVGRIPWMARHSWALLLSMLGVLVAATLAVSENVVPVLLFGIPAGVIAWAGTTMSGKPTRLRLALRALVVLVFGLAFLPLLLPRPVKRGSVPPLPPQDSPNLVMVVLDTVRLDHLSTYGYPLETSPALTELADEGIRFDQARVNGMWSLPSHATFFTGVHPSLHGAHYEHWQLDEDRQTLAQALARFGYQTVCITGNPLISRGLGTGRGFHHVNESWRSHWIPESLTVWRLLRPLWDHDQDKGGAAGVRFLRRWLAAERDPQRPFFLFVNVMDPHAPYSDVPPEYQASFLPPGVSRRQARALSAKVFFHHVFASPLDLAPAEVSAVRRSYDGSTRYGDAVLGDIVSAIDMAKLGESTLIAVTSDHGELLGEHDMWGHVHSLYDELLRVPLVVRQPGVIPAGLVSDAAVEGVDLVPTFLSAAGVPEDAWPETYGRDLAAHWAPGRPVPGSRWSVAEHFTPSMLPQTAEETMTGDLDGLFVRRRSAVQGGTKYVAASNGEERLFDLYGDSGELQDLSGDAEALEPGRKALSAWVQDMDAAWSAEVTHEVPEMDEATRKRLKELGYIE